MEVLVARVLRFQLGRDHRRREGPSGRARVLARPPHPRPPGARRVAPVVHGAPHPHPRRRPWARGRTRIRAVVQCVTRSYLIPRGRTRIWVVVPLSTRSYPDARGRTLEGL